jgi:hypothetical protein
MSFELQKIVITVKLRGDKFLSQCFFILFARFRAQKLQPAGLTNIKTFILHHCYTTRQNKEIIGGCKRLRPRKVNNAAKTNVFNMERIERVYLFA